MNRRDAFRLWRAHQIDDVIEQVAGREIRTAHCYSSPMLHAEITQDIIGAGMAILNELKPGLDEKLYENALVIELKVRGHAVDQQRRFEVHYRGQLIGILIPDLIVDGQVIVDPKVVTAFNETHVAQMIGYLNITDLQVALLLSFKEARLHWKRVVNERTRNAMDPTGEQ